MSITSPVDIRYKNETANTDFQVMVFSRNYASNVGGQPSYAAWEVLRGQTEVRFKYTAEISVGATYRTEDQEIISGPFGAKLGTTWSVNQSSVTATAELLEDKAAAANPENTIVIRNKKPKAWSGRKFDIGIYKSQKLLLVQKDVRVGDQVDFTLKPIISFAVVRNMHVGKVFTSLEITSALTEFDLSEYPNGIIVTLKQKGSSGQYEFSAESMV